MEQRQALDSKKFDVAGYKMAVDFCKEYNYGDLISWSHDNWFTARDGKYAIYPVCGYKHADGTIEIREYYYRADSYLVISD